MMKLRSKMALLLALMMLVTVFIGGCGKNGEPANKPDDSTTAAPTTALSTPEVKKEVEFSVGMSSGAATFGNDDISKKIFEDLKVRIKAVDISGDKFKLMAASNELPDVYSMWNGADKNRVFNYIEQGLIRDIPEKLINKYPKVKELVDPNTSNGALGASVKSATGKYYVLSQNPSKSGIYNFFWSGIYYRKDWAANVGITKEPETIDDLYTMLKAFTTGDPDKNGKEDTKGLTGLWSAESPITNVIFSAYGINPDGWIEEDGKVIPGYASKKCIEPLKFFQKLYQEKILDNEIGQNKGTVHQSKFTQNLFGAVANNADAANYDRLIRRTWAKGNNLNSTEIDSAKNPDVKKYTDAIGVFSTLKKDTSSKLQIFRYVGQTTIEINAKVKDDYIVDRILETVSYFLDPKVNEMIIWGIEGVDYKKENGKIIPSIDPKTNAAVVIPTKYPSVPIANIFSGGFDDDATDINKPKEMLAGAKALADKYNKVDKVPEITGARFISTPTKNTLTVNYGDEFLKMVVGTDSIEVAFEKFLTQAKKEGLDKAIEETTAAAKKAGIVK